MGSSDAHGAMGASASEATRGAFGTEGVGNVAGATTGRGANATGTSSPPHCDFRTG